jgi:hypothetical protein
MAVIDTLKLARALRDKAGFTDEAAEATAEAINSALGEQMARKDDLEQAARLNFMQWQIGIIAALQIAALVKLFVH